MKKILAIFTIPVLLFLLVLPPILRLTLPDLNSQAETKNNFYKYLNCTNNTYSIRTNYENDKVQLIVIRKNKTQEEPTPSQNPNLDELFNVIKSDSMVVYNQFEEGEAILLDFTTSIYSNLNLSNLNQLPNQQKTYYEQNNLTCNITEEEN